MSTSKTFDAIVVVSSAWFGKVQAVSLPEAQDAARDAFNEGQLRQSGEEIVHVDVRDALKTFEVNYTIEQGFSVRVEAANAEDAEAIVQKRLEDAQAVLPESQHVHFEGIVADAQEVTP